MTFTLIIDLSIENQALRCGKWASKILLTLASIIGEIIMKDPELRHKFLELRAGGIRHVGWASPMLIKSRERSELP